ncbi:putative thioredoxin [Arcanobacterium wilhelmae]|uniref:Thioredoxin n=1 Tax=Arcanobacterium wilhelmae TaxID=1803177 RepID=A0ABT9N9V8_9ACTO|nr:tetratricopeptide repeat protein [Arcanobacterium wilhelmae]MDP9800494.1 putative thioredoxin [Arcanobacterium wilhelmae]WFN89913.1 tetratricopeptide repeat protein [Arcanobacterium wilhelmae]
MAGAFDLSTLKAKNEPEPATAAGEAVPGKLEVALTEESLQTAVNTSMKVPVLVAFTSPRSDNSAKLLEMVRPMVAAKAGRIQLAVADVDAHPQVAGVFGVNGVPALAVLLQGNPVPIVQGLPGEADLRPQIDKIIASAAQYGINGVLDPNAEVKEPEVPPLHKEGLEAMKKGDYAAARAAYEKALAQDPKDHEAQSALAQVNYLDRMAGMPQMVDPAQAQAMMEKIAAAPMDDVETQLTGADIEFASRPDIALGRLIEAVKATSGEDRERVRTRILEFFDLLGQQSEIVAAARKALAAALF